MRAYIVTVHPGSSDRYSDTLWISRDGAARRVADPCSEFARRGKVPKDEQTNEGWAAWITECEIEDAALGEPVKPAKKS